jgi:hypothetical protein
MSKHTDLRLIDKPLYRYWQAIYLSFFSPKIYLDAFKRWNGFGALYVLFVLMIFCLPFSLRLMFFMHQYIHSNLLTPFTQMPILYIQNGEISIDEKMPFIVKNASGEVTAIIKESGSFEDEQKANPKLSILITKNTINIKPPNTETFLGIPLTFSNQEAMSQTLSESDTEIFNPKDLIDNRIIKNVIWSLLIALYPLIVLLFYAMYLVLLFTLPFLGQVCSQSLFGFKVRFGQACRIFALAVTPQIALFFTLASFNMLKLIPNYSYLILMAIYFFLALAAVKRESKKMVHA